MSIDGGRDESMKCKLALVTGAQQGIGRAITIALARSGVDVIASCFDDDVAMQSLVDEVSSLGVKCHSFKADLSDREKITDLLSFTDSIGCVDILINNAAIFPRSSFLTVPEEMWDKVQFINIKAPFLCTQHVARAMVEHKRKGCVINMSSGAAFRGGLNASHYVTSKAGVVGLTKSAALELAPYGIRVNAVAPGLTDTAQPRFGMSEDELQNLSGTVPLGQMATPEEVANIVLMLTSDAASHVTGQTWHVNGGTYLS